MKNKIAYKILIGFFLLFINGSTIMCSSGPDKQSGGIIIHSPTKGKEHVSALTLKAPPSSPVIPRRELSDINNPIVNHVVGKARLDSQAPYIRLNNILRTFGAYK